MKLKNIPKNVKCNCGHTAKDHYMGTGWCHHSEHLKSGECGCTWFHPNDKWVLKQKNKKLNKNKK